MDDVQRDFYGDDIESFCAAMRCLDRSLSSVELENGFPLPEVGSNYHLITLELLYRQKQNGVIIKCLTTYFVVETPLIPFLL